MDKIKILLILGIFLFSINQANAQGGIPWQNKGNTSQKMLQRLGPADANYDLRFMNMMINHHKRAVIMSQDALKKAKHSELRQMAQNIINSQTKEINQMEAWRKQWYGK